MQSIKVDTGSIRFQVGDLHFAKILDTLRPTVLPAEVLQIYESSTQARISWQQPSRDTALIMQRLKVWMNSLGSSILIVQTSPRSYNRTSDMVLEVTKLLTGTTYPVFWHMSPPSRTFAPATSDIFKSLVFQVLQHDPNIVSKDSRLSNLEAFRSPHKVQEWSDLAALVLSHIPQCFIVLDTQRWQQTSNPEDPTPEQFYQALASFFTTVSGAGTIIKMLVVAYHVRTTLLPDSPAYSQYTAIMGPPLPASRRIHQSIATRLRGRGGTGRGIARRQLKPMLTAR